MDLREELLFDTQKENYAYGIGLIVIGLITLGFIIGFVFLIWGLYALIVGGFQGNLTKSGQSKQQMKMQGGVNKIYSNNRMSSDNEKPVKSMEYDKSFKPIGFCPNCGSGREENAKFCRTCGEKFD